MSRPAENLPLTAQHGACGVTLMPRDKVIATAGGRFLIMTEREAFDLEAALRDLHRQVNELDALRDAA